MRKIYILILLGFCVNAIAQATKPKYSFVHTFNSGLEGSWCNDPMGNWGWSFLVNSTVNTMITDNFTPVHCISSLDEYKEFQFEAFLDKNSFINYNAYGTSYGRINGALSIIPCDDTNPSSISITASELIIKGSTPFVEVCSSYLGIHDFKPINLSISSAPTEVCSGTNFTLTASPAGFPDVAYHWQYSTDNEITWVNFPATMQKSEGSSVRTTNDTPNINFSMDEILGTNHSDFFNKQIYFRLGYDGRPFTTSKAITYSPCAPVVIGISYEGPKCYGDYINKIEVTFDRELYIDKGEVLKSFSLRDRANPMISIFQFLTDETFSGKTFSFQKADLDKITLENGHKYFIQQQAYIGTAGKGILDSDSQYDLEYVAPAALKFIATKKQDVSCNGGSDGTIEIKVWGGTPKTEGLKYNYYVDGNLLTQNTIETTTSGETTAILPGISVLKDVNGLIIPHQIKVTDAENCFEK